MNKGQFIIKRGDTPTFQHAFTLNRQPLDLGGGTGWFTAKRQPEDPDDQAVWQKSSGTLGGMLVTDAPGGLAESALLAADTQDLPGDTTLYYDVQYRSAGGQITTTEEGTILVQPDVTRTSTP